MFTRGSPHTPISAPPPPTSLSLKCGKMLTTSIIDTPRLLVEADVRRGLLVLETQDGTTHLKWKDRQTLALVDDLLLFPGDQSLERVDTGRPEDRVYLLSFKADKAANRFFWMQEVDAGKDEERVKGLNVLMNQPPQLSAVSVAAQNARGARTAAANQMVTPGASAPAVDLDELSNILNAIGYSAVEAPAAPTPAPAETTPEDSADQMEQDKAEEQPPSKKDAHVLTEDELFEALQSVARTPNLARIVTGDAIESLLDDEEAKQALMALLPEGSQTEEELRITIRSPQLRQALVSLSRALDSDDFNNVMANFGIDAKAGNDYLARGDGVGAFIAALEAARIREEKEETGKKQ